LPLPARESAKIDFQAIENRLKIDFQAIENRFSTIPTLRNIELVQPSGLVAQRRACRPNCEIQLPSHQETFPFWLQKGKLVIGKENLLGTESCMPDYPPPRVCRVDPETHSTSMYVEPYLCIGDRRSLIRALTRFDQGRHPVF